MAVDCESVDNVVPIHAAARKNIEQPECSVADERDEYERLLYAALDNLKAKTAAYEAACKQLDAARKGLEAARKGLDALPKAQERAMMFMRAHALAERTLDAMRKGMLESQHEVNRLTEQLQKADEAEKQAAEEARRLKGEARRSNVGAVFLFFLAVLLGHML